MTIFTKQLLCLYLLMFNISMLAQTPVNDDCENAIIIDCGQTISGSITDATFRDINNGCSYEDNADVWYQFSGTGQIVDFEFISGFNGSIEVDILLNDCNSTNSCIDDFTIYVDQPFKNRSFFAEENTIYLFRISEYCCDNGDFSFSLQCNDLVSNDTCDSAITLTCGQAVSGTTIFATEEYLHTNCGTTRDRDVWYKVVGTDQIVELFTDMPFRMSFQVYDSSCAGILSNCIGDDFLGNSFTFFAELGEEYLINIFDAYNEEFAFSINCSTPIANDECDEALLLSCGDNVSGSAQFLTLNDSNASCHDYPDVWYKIIGDGSVLKFVFEDSDSEVLSFQIYENGCLSTSQPCDNFFTIGTSSPNFTFLTEPGIEYLISLAPNGFNQFGYNFNFSIECFDEIVNDQCENAINIGCGDQVNGNLENTTFTDFSDGCNYIYGNDIWYSFLGDGQIYEFTILDNDVDHLRLLVSSESCTSTYFNCFEPIELLYNSNGYNENDSGLFATQNGVQYWIRVSSDSTFPSGEYSFQLRCIEAEPNDDCVNAIPVVCDQQYAVNLASASFSDSYNGCDYEGDPDVWYILSGDGNIYSFNYENSDNDLISFRIYTGSCNGGLSCYSNFTLSNNSPSQDFLTQSGIDYIIELISYQENPGDLSFNVTCPDPIAGDFCDTALLIDCGMNVLGNTTTATYTPSDGCFGSEARDLWYSFVGDGNVWTFTHVQSEENRLRFNLFYDTCASGMDDCEFWFDISGNFSQADEFNLQTSVGLQYFVKVEQFSYGTDPKGEFEFAVSCQEPIQNDSCDGAIAITCDTVVQGTTEGATFEFGDESCGAIDAPDVWYTITGQDNIIELEYISSQFDDMAIQIFKSDCNFHPYDCPEFLFLNASNSPNAFFFAELDSTYLIRVTLNIYDPEYVGGFSFGLTCHDLAVNDDCINAIPLECDDVVNGSTAFATTEIDDGCNLGSQNDLWYSIQGDDALHAFQFISSSAGNISFDVYEGMCDDLGERIFRFYYDDVTDIPINFFAYSGSTYLIRVTTGCGLDSEDFSFSHLCPPPYVNDFCEDAIELVCGNEYSGMLETATIDFANEEQTCGSSYNIIRHDVWFTIVGDGLIYQFTDLLNNSHYTAISIIESTCDQDLSQCAYQFDITNDFSNSFLAEVGQSYLIRLYDQQNESEFNFQIDCFTPAANDDCLNSTPISCGDVIDLDLSAASNSGLVDECNTYPNQVPDLWYSITGTDEFVNLSLDGPISLTHLNLDIYKQTCENLQLECPQSGSLYQDNSYTFFAEMDSIYLIRMSDDRTTQARINISCQKRETNDNCEDAIDISCGQTVGGNTNFATSVMIYNGCYYENIEDVWYTITGTGDIIEFHHLQSVDDRIILQIYNEPCASTYLQCNTSLDISLNNGNNGYNYFLAEQDSIYYIRVFGEYNNPGVFEFELNCLPPADNNECENAENITCGTLLEGNSTFSSLAIDQPNCYYNPHFSDLWYTLTGDGMIHSFDYIFGPSFSLQIYIFEDNCQLNNCDNYAVVEVTSNNSDLFFAESGTDYLLAVTFDEDDLGEFSLELLCHEPIENDDCTGASPISCGEVIVGSTEFALPPNNYSSSDVWYSFLGTGDVIELSFLQGLISRINIDIFSSGCDTNATFEQSIEILPSNSHYFITMPGIQYYFQVSTGYSDSKGDFAFALNCFDPIINDSCETATTITCGSIIADDNSMATYSNNFNGCHIEEEPDLWYVLEGTNQIIEFNLIGSYAGSIYFQLYQDLCQAEYESCLSEFSINSNSTRSFYAASGTSYLIRVHTYNYQSGGQYSFSLTCAEPEANDLCENAIQIGCGNSVTGNTALAGVNNDFSHCVSNLYQADLWYFINGTDELIEFSYLYSSANNIRLHIYPYQACGDLENACPEQLYLSYSSTNNLFYAEAGNTYFIRATTGDDIVENGEFSFDVACHEPLENDNCEDAIEINCGQLINATLDLATAIDFSCNNDFNTSPGVWYSFFSTGDIVYEFNYSGDFQEQIYIFLDDCSVTDCYNSILNFNSTDLQETIYLPEGEYSIYLTSNYGGITDFSFQINCAEPIENDFCATPIHLNCGDTVTDSLALATGYTGDFDYCPSVAYAFTGPGLWYTYQGSGDVIQIDVNAEFNSPQLVIFNADCESLSCESFYFNTESSIYFQTEESITYLLYMTNEYLNDFGQFSLSINCDYYGTQDPCSCNNDQSTNGARDGTFNETISIFNTDQFDTWTVIDVGALNGTSTPIGISAGDNLAFNSSTSNHEILFDHIDDSGYSVQITGPYDLGISINDTFTITNICSYPEIDMSRVLTPLYHDQVYDLTDLISEIHNYPGTFEFYINGEPTTQINGSELLFGEQHTLEIIFQGDFVNNTISEGPTPAFPGCSTEANLTFMMAYSQEIPTLSQWGLICLFLALNIIGVIKIREKYFLRFTS